MARQYNTEKFKPGETKCNCPPKTEGGETVVRVFIGQDPTTREFRFQTWSDSKQRGVGRPLCVAEIPSAWTPAK